ncbi:beta-N-acetylhexosaminidase [Prolixibacteraceae bacterium Z1-6]|uniref:beta-N-acetylhexosaminidase n=1 Tax=Draconibacterium aestuarii TaxID=2998507 RepID=A0A9X3F8V1_9BACT|nr:beta-N-acetylhexosaminidase [Prolixibacteraceae bacterium Z1-6]
MKYLILILLIPIFVCCQKSENSQLVVIPQPNNVEIKAGVLKLDKNCTISFNSAELKPLAELFAEQIKDDIELKITDAEQAKIQLQLTGTRDAESYSLATSRKGVTISASTEKGIFYGLQTLKQLLLFSQSNELPLVSVQDVPRFGWRGLMLDESRCFFGVEKVKQLLDLMALHKLNVFHWHLTDVPGWRIEIKQYPKLATVGGIGNDLDPDAPAQFYTQEEIKEIVKYASERFIEVIPEIDMPGHARAANRAYPEFSGGGSQSHPEFTFNPGYEGTYTYLTNILREITELFPSKYIHLGGDEVHFGNENWNKDVHVKQLMSNQNLTNLREVEAYFIHRMADSIKTLNRTVIGWDEIVDFGLDQENSVVMWWRHDKPNILQNALNKNYKVVLCPRIPLYFDFDQAESHKYGRKWGGAFSPMEMVYQFPPDSLPGFNENTKLIKGIQANIWTERIQDNTRLDFMTYPRLSALAEAGWTNNQSKKPDDFKRRLKPMLEYLNSINIGYYNPFMPKETPEPTGKFRE